MLRIGICDDDEIFLRELERELIEYVDGKNITTEIGLFPDAQLLLDALEMHGLFDILFLDIELKRDTGIEIGKKIRSDLKNEVMQIVFVSSKEQYAMQLFELRPMNFLIKPIDGRKVAYIMDEYNRLSGFQGHFFTYQKNKQEFKINEQCIIYFQSQGKKINILTQEGTKEFYGKLSDVSVGLSPHLFCRIHKSFIVNSRYVREFRPGEVEMVNTDIIPISQSMRIEVNQWLLKNK